MGKFLCMFVILLLFLPVAAVHGQECASGDTRPCGSDIGICETGLRTCIRGQWSECLGEKKPASNFDICDNGIDDNCNGETDEGCEDVNETCNNNRLDPEEEGTDCGGTCPAKCFSFPWIELTTIGLVVFFVGLALYYVQREAGKRPMMSESLGKD
jgi:hypothetical protein